MVKLLALVALVVSAIVGGMAWWADHPDAGGFRVEGTEIIGPDDQPFVPIGVNMLGPDAFFNPHGRTAGQAEVLATAWNINTVRLNICLPEGCPYTGVHNELNDDLDALVREYTAEGLVVILALHQVAPGEWPDAATLDRMAEWWRDVALRYGNDPYVWFNLVNEPGSETPASSQWLDVHRRLLDAVRGAGAENMVILDGTQWGQEIGGHGDDHVETENSAILSFGDEIKGDDDAVAFSFHVYDQWGVGLADDDDAGRDARMVDFVNRVHEAGHAVLIGETGSGEEPCCDPLSLATQSAYRVAAQLGLGILAWHGQGIDGFQLVDQPDELSLPGKVDDPTSPGNLTWQGQLLWDLAHARG